LGQVRRQHFDGDDPVGGAVLGAEDFAHPAAVQHVKKLVSPE
jgi:hypothetical protein